MEVPVNYKIVKHYVHPVGPFDWELEYVCTIENVDEKGGTFTVIANFYDGDRLAYRAKDEKYIGPGQTVTFTFKSRGLSYSTDWEDRYKVKPEIIPPTKIEMHVVTKYYTKYYTKYVSLIQLLLSGGRA